MEGSLGDRAGEGGEGERKFARGWGRIYFSLPPGLGLEDSLSVDF